MISINLKCQEMYLPTSATNWNFSSWARTVKLEKMTKKAINKGKILTCIPLNLIIRVNKLLFKLLYNFLSSKSFGILCKI